MINLHLVNPSNIYSHGKEFFKFKNFYNRLKN